MVAFASLDIFLQFSLETSPELEELPELVEELDVLQFPLKTPLLIAAANKESFSIQFSVETLLLHLVQSIFGEFNPSILC